MYPPIPIPPYPQRLPPGRKAKSCLWVFRWAHPAASRDLHPFIPITGFILKSRNHPFEQICRNQHHHGKVLFLVPYPVAAIPGICVFPGVDGNVPYFFMNFLEKKLRT